MAAEKALVFEFELIDSSVEQSAEDAERIASLAAITRELLPKYGIESIDIAPVAERARNSNLQACGACDTAMAKELGAKYAVTGTVQKVSSAMINVSLYMRDAETNALVKAASVDIRGSSETDWTRGIRSLIKNRIFRGQTPQ